MTEAVTPILIEPTQTLDTMLHQVLNQALVAIGAKAGSLMLVDTKHGILQIKARLGVPRPGRRSERVFKTDDSSIAGLAVRNQRSYLCEDVTKDPVFARSRSGQNFCSVLAVPIIHDGRVLAVINADAAEPRAFTDWHRQLLESVAAQAAPPIAQRISIIDALAEVGVELTRLPQKGGVERVLEKIAELAVRSLGADAVTVYQYDESQDEFLVEGTGPTMGGLINDPRPMQRKVHPGDVPWTVVKERKSGFYANVQDEEFLTRDVRRPGDDPRARFVTREGIRSMAALLLPSRAEVGSDEVVGVMFANYRTPHTFNIDEVAALSTFADYAAVAILNARHEERRRDEQLRMVGSISANFAHRMLDLAGPGRVAAQLLREHVDANDTMAHRQLDMIEREAGVLFALAERLRDRITETGGLADLAVVNASEVLGEALDMVAHIAGGVEVVSAIAPDLPPVLSVRFQLRQVLYDLMKNAVEAVAGQERPMLTVRALFNQETQRVDVEIVDNGAGIHDVVRNRLFSPGLTTKKEGLGIGLWYSRTFLQATGGDLILQASSPGRGTTFLVELPSVTTAEGPASAPADRRTRHEVDVLIVDDEPAWCDIMRDALPTDALTVRTATSYGQAYDALMAARIRLLVVDIQLSAGNPADRDGLRLLNDLHMFASTPQVILVAKDARQVVDTQANWLVGVVSKGEFNVEEFRALVRRAIPSAEPT